MLMETMPSGLLDRLADARAKAPALVALAGEVMAPYREALSRLSGTAGDPWSLNDDLVALWEGTGAGALRDDLDRVVTTLALVDIPAEGEVR